jgi:UDP-N-acetylmuramoyl-L-alanyl-D-glutamate--2,6-diaminopimelate ligase
MKKPLNTIKKIIPTKLFKALQPAYHFLLNYFANIIMGRPSQQLIVIGVTGTTGKTSSVYLIAKTLASAGYRVGYTSTAMFNDGQKEWLNDKKMTMVGGFFTQNILRKMVKNKCQYAVIETTSEGIRQFRHRFINYDVLVFTGLYPEHIESHGSFENYKKAKGQLFAHLKNCRTKYVNDKKFVEQPKTELQKLNWQRVKKTIVANFADDSAGYFLDFWAELKIGYTMENYHDKSEEIDYEVEVKENLELIKGANIQASAFGTGFDVLLLSNFFSKKDDDAQSIHIDLKLLGDFSATNSMNAVGVALSQGLSLEQIKVGLEKIKGITGRMEMINVGQNFSVVVDYAFEPRALTKLYETIKLLPHNQIIHVLGSTGGGRDRSRRPILGGIAGSQADFVIITNEDPYDEDPVVIMEEVALGAEKAGKANKISLFKILDRREAIKKALILAKEGDIVLITGKGSEQAICVKDGQKIPWDDRTVAREELQKICG